MQIEGRTNDKRKGEGEGEKSKKRAVKTAVWQGRRALRGVPALAKKSGLAPEMTLPEMSITIFTLSLTEFSPKINKYMGAQQKDGTRSKSYLARIRKLKEKGN